MTKLFIVYIQRNQDTRHTICQWIQSFKLIHISTFSYIHKEAYMSSTIKHVYKTFHRHNISLFRHLSTRRYIYFIHHIYTSFDIDTLFTLFDIYALFCRTPRMFLMKHNVCYSTLFDFLLLHLISFIVSFCYYLSNRRSFCRIYGYGSFVEWRRNLSDGGGVSYCMFRQNSSRRQLPQKTYGTKF